MNEVCAWLVPPPAPPRGERLRSAPDLSAYQPPKPYDLALAKHRAANATPETAEDRWKKARLAEFEREAEARRLRAADEPVMATDPRLTAAELADPRRYAPPDPYTLALKRERETLLRRDDANPPSLP